MTDNNNDTFGDLYKIWGFTTFESPQPDDPRVVNYKTDLLPIFQHSI